MEKNKPGMLFLGKWNAVTFIAISFGALLFGVLTVYGNIPVFDNISLASAMVVPVFVGGFFGAVPAFATMYIGRIAAYLIADWPFWFDWAVAYGVLGLFIGVLPLYGAKIDEGIFTIKQAFIYAACCIVGNMIAFCVVLPIVSTIIYANNLEFTFLQSFIASIGNSAVLVFVGIPILFYLAGFYRKRKIPANNAAENVSEEEQEQE